MDEAAEAKEFLKAHEAKQGILKLEEQIKGIEADTSYLSQSLSDTNVTPKNKTRGAQNASAVSTPESVTPKNTTKGAKNASTVSTPGSVKTTSVNSRKLTPSQLAKQEEMKRKKEAILKEKLKKKAEKEAELKQKEEDKLKKE